MWLPCVSIARSGRVTLSMSYRFPISPQGSEPRWWSSIWLLTHRAPNSAPSTDAILVACLIFNQQSELWAVDLPCNYHQFLANAIEVPICAMLELSLKSVPQFQKVFSFKWIHILSPWEESWRILWKNWWFPLDPPCPSTSHQSHQWAIYQQGSNIMIISPCTKNRLTPSSRMAHICCAIDSYLWTSVSKAYLMMICVGPAQFMAFYCSVAVWCYINII